MTIPFPEPSSHRDEMTNQLKKTIYQFQPLLVVISGPSGVGKDSVIQGVLERNPSFHHVITATTRAPRPHEKHGMDYYFVSRDEFISMIDQGEMLEYALVYQDYKGVPRQQIKDALANGLDVIMRVDVQGAETIRALCPDALLIFLVTASEEELINRLKARRTETQEQLDVRIATVRREMETIKVFDYIVVNRNGHLEDAVEAVQAIILSEHHRVKPRKVDL